MQKRRSETIRSARTLRARYCTTNWKVAEELSLPEVPVTVTV